MNKLKKFTGIIVTAAVFLLLFVACLYYGLRAKAFYVVTPGTTSSGMIDFSKTSIDEIAENYVNREMDRQIVITGTGEMKFYEWQLTRAYDSASETFDFSPALSYISDYLQSSDYVLGDIETTLAGSGNGTDTSIYGYGADKDNSSYNTPEVLAENLASTGFDMIVTANEHAYDSGTDGLTSTIDYLTNAGLSVSGTVKNSSDARYAIINVHGMQTGFIAYTNDIFTAEGTTGSADGGSDDTGVTAAADGTDAVVDDIDSAADGTADASGDGASTDSTNDIIADAVDTTGDTAAYNVAEGLVNTLSSYDSAKVTALCDQIQQMKNDGAEIVVVSLSFGTEYASAPDDQQKSLAAQLAQAGADVIFGNNAGVPQTIDVLTNTAEDGSSRKTVVIYSMGSLLTAQQYVDGTGVNRDLGMICNVVITKSKNSAQVTGLEIVPIFSNWSTDNILSIPVIDAYENSDTYADILDSIYASRITTAYDSVFPTLLQSSGLSYTVEDSKYKISLEN